MPYYTNIKYEIEFVGRIWFDVSADVIDVVTGFMGIGGASPLDRVASTGSMEFTLRNDAGCSGQMSNFYTPGVMSMRVGDDAVLYLTTMTTGLKVRLSFTYNGTEYMRFYGRIPANGIQIEADNFNNRVIVTVRDFMEQAAMHELDLPAYTTSKRIDEIVPLIVTNMPFAPDSTHYHIGSSTFASVFDTTTARTRAMEEFAKLAISELGYIYVKQLSASPEVLCVDGRNTRSSQALANVITTGGTVTATFENCANKVAISHGRDYYNKIQVVSYPKEVDAAATTVLFNMDREISIEAGGTIAFTGRFRDPNNEAVNVAGMNMVSPVGTVDYTMFTGSGGTGSDITADLAVTATYGANGVGYSLVNGNAAVGYVNKLQARGKGVYTYNPIEKNYEYAAGITADGSHILRLDMPYQDNPLQADDFGNILLNQYKQKSTIADSIGFIANRSDLLLAAFVQLQVGDMIHVISSPTNEERDYFIHNISFTIIPGGVVEVIWGIKPASYDTFLFWELDSVTKSQLDTTTILGF